MTLLLRVAIARQKVRTHHTGFCEFRLRIGRPLAARRGRNVASAHMLAPKR